MPRHHKTHDTQIRTSSYRPTATMASPRVVSALLLLVLVAALGGSRIPKAEGKRVCNVSITSLWACKSAVNSWFPGNPSPKCCAAVAGADFGCFCSLLKSPLLWVYGVDADRVKKLPSLCNVNRPLPECAE